MRGPLDDKARLLHIHQAIAYVNEFLENRPLEIIGEVANHLSATTKEMAPEIEWRKIVAFRNFVTHEYLGIDLELVWDIATNTLEPLKQSVERVLQRFEP